MLSGRGSYKLLITLGFLLSLNNCSVERNTGTTRFYHGLTARFNIYFNGYESYKAGIQKISNSYQDDFSELLRVFESSDPAVVSLCSSDMETAIQKASKLISLKSITAKPEFKTGRELSEDEKALLEMKEFNEWIDDSYFLIGKARFHKHEFNDAAAVFSYCIAEANDPEIRTESSIWLTRINSEKGNFPEAGRLLNENVPDPSAPKALRSVYYTTLADMYIKQKRYAEAIDPLTRSLELISGKRARYRLTYLLAQLYERSGNSEKAIELYRDVVKMNPPYTVEFNARINIAGVFDVNSGNSGEILNELNRMLRDSKNNDFQDRIYYALGNLMKKEGKEKEALEYYRKSALASSVNQNQKGRSYLALAEYFYSKPDYINAARYYDSTVYFIDDKFPDYMELRNKSTNLNLLVKHLNVIQTEDSLQKVASMPQNERDALISGIIDKVIRAESEGRTSEYADRANIGQYYENERRFSGNIAQEGKWYFYNQTALTFGRTEFRRRWGDRRLEDNWRRANRTRVTVQQATASGQDENSKFRSDTSTAETDNKKPEFYLKNLPINDSLIAVSDEKTATAYFNAARVFTENINDKIKAAEYYETILTRYPDHELVPETLYELYRLYRDTNSQKAEISRQRLLEKYPESEFTAIISDPDYYNKKVSGARKMEELYRYAFDLYNQEKFNESIAVCDSAANAGIDSYLLPKFMLLRAYSVARTSDEKSFSEELNKVIKRWPGSEEGKRASELSASLMQKLPELKIEEDKTIAAEIYLADTTSLYSFMIIIMDATINLNQASFDVISYNIDNHTNRNYRTEGTIVDNRYVKITVSGFKNNTEAWDYYRSFSAEKLIRNTSGAQKMTFLINISNLQKFDEDKNPERYYLFFNENYLRAEKNR